MRNTGYFNLLHINCKVNRHIPLTLEALPEWMLEASLHHHIKHHVYGLRCTIVAAPPKFKTSKGYGAAAILCSSGQN